MNFRVFLFSFCFLNSIHGFSYQKADSYTSSLLQIDSLINRAEKFQYTHPDSSYYFITQALEIARTNSFNLQEAVCQQFLGKILFQQGIYSEAAEKWRNSSLIFQIEGNYEGLIDNYNFLGKLYSKTKSTNLSLEAHQKAYDLARDSDNRTGQAFSLGWIGGYHEKNGDYALALDCQWTALKILQADGLDDLSADIKENLGSIYEDKEDFDSAFYYFQKAYSLNFQSGDSLKLINNLNNLGDIYRKKGLLDSALLLSNQALEMSRRLQDNYQLSSAYRDMSKVYQEKRNFYMAYVYLDSSRLTYEVIFSNETARQLAVMEALYDVDAKDQKIIKLEHSHLVEMRIIILLIILVLVIIGSSMLFYTRHKLKAEAAEALLMYQKEVAANKQKLIEIELRNSQLKEEKMMQDMESNSKALAAETLHVIDKNRLMEEIREKLKTTLVHDSKEQKKKIRNLIKMIDNNFVRDTDWDDFRNNFENVHETFYQNLHSISSDLSPADLRLATLLKLNLSSKDIASTLNISAESLRISRYRLKKKLHLKKSESLQKFILSL
jgi:tetratricopeptide (TPR) repeat protein